MKANILDINGKKIKEIELPKCFSQEVRKDIIAKVLEVKKNKQPYSPSPVAGKQHSASGIIIHRRKVWKSGYGRGKSRIPRKIMSRRGSQFNWVGAEVPNTRGGKRAHPPKTASMINTKKINKKELRIALFSALSATALKEFVLKRYERLKNKEIKNFPLIVESKFASLKTKEIISSLKEILGESLFDLALKKRSVRSGRGKLRGRKYKKSAGLLVVLGKEEKLKTKAFDVVNVSKISVNNLAKGEEGRLTLYTEKAINELGEKTK